MSNLKEQARIERKNAKRQQLAEVEAVEVEEPIEVGAEGSGEECVATVPGGPEPVGLKEKVKGGFVTPEEALVSLFNNDELPSRSMVTWLKNKKKSS